MRFLRHLVLTLATLLSLQSLQATTFYVAPTGNDTTNSGTSPSTPFKTIKQATDSIQSGDIVYVANGTYNESVEITVSGTPTAYVKFISTNIWGAKVVSPGAYAAIQVSANYVEIDGFDVTNPVGHGISGENFHHIKMLNNHAHNCGCSGITAGHDPTKPPSISDYYTIEGNTCNNNASQGWFSGISVYEPIAFDSLPGFHIIIRNNICYGNIELTPARPVGAHTDGNGIICDDWNFTQNPGTPYAYNGLVENNLCYDNGGAGVKTSWADHVTVRNNTAYRNFKDLLNPDSFRGELYDQETSGNLWINNIGWADPSIDPRNSGMMDRYSPSSPGGAQNTWVNNIFYNNTPGLSAQDIGDGSAPILINNKNGVNPLLVSPALNGTGNFKLQSTSPAINAGTSTYGTATDGLDLAALPRIVGTAIDIGAYEYQTVANVLVTSVAISPSAATLTTAGGKVTLVKTILPSTATNQNVTWTSSNPAAATVNSSGVVTAVANGTAIITATSVDGSNKSATSTITVSIASSVLVTSVTVSPTTTTLTAAGAQATLTKTVTPTNATNQAVTWTSSNPAFATVNASGVVTAVANGTVTITATSTDGSNRSGTATVTVNIPATAADKKIQAESFTTQNLLSTWSTGIGGFDTGSYAKYSAVNLSTGYVYFQLRVASTLAGSIDVRKGSPTGTIIATVTWTPTANWNTYKTVNVAATGASGIQDIYLTYKSDTANVDYLVFTNSPTLK